MDTHKDGQTLRLAETSWPKKRKEGTSSNSATDCDQHLSLIKLQHLPLTVMPVNGNTQSCCNRKAQLSLITPHNTSGSITQFIQEQQIYGTVLHITITRHGLSMRRRL